MLGIHRRVALFERGEECRAQTAEVRSGEHELVVERAGHLGHRDSQTVETVFAAVNQDACLHPWCFDRTGARSLVAHVGATKRMAIDGIEGDVHVLRLESVQRIHELLGFIFGQIHHD